VLKAAVVHLLLVTKAPLEYWCFALEYVCLLQSHIARRKLGWRTAQERHFGETPDISVFRFTFWSPVWYYSPSVPFPKSKMLPGRFIGIAQNTGDVFCFLVLTEPDESGTQSVIARSVVRRRFLREEPPIVEETAMATLRFYKSDGKTLLDDPVENTDHPLSDLVSTDDSRAPDSEEAPFLEEPAADALTGAIEEVYGPPLKRQCIETFVKSGSVGDDFVRVEETAPALPPQQRAIPSLPHTHTHSQISQSLFTVIF
jgi:hypothetical protein